MFRVQRWFWLAVFLIAVGGAPPNASAQTIRTPQPEGDQIIEFYDARASRVPFKGITNPSGEEVFIQIVYYNIDLTVELAEEWISIPSSGNVVIDPTLVNGGVLNGTAGVYVATPVQGLNDRTPIVPPCPLVGSATLANLDLGSGFGGNVFGRLAINKNGGRATPGSVVDGENVSYQRIDPWVLMHPLYYNPNDLAPAEIDGNRVILVVFDERYDSGFHLIPRFERFKAYFADRFGVLVAKRDIDVYGVLMSDLESLAGNNLDSSGKVFFKAMNAGSGNRFGVWSESLGTFASGDRMPGVEKVPDFSPAPSPTRTQEPVPTPTLRPTPSLTPSRTPTPRPTGTPIVVPTPSPTKTPKPTPTRTYIPPTNSPRPTFTPRPTATPTVKPTASPTPRPTASPTPKPTHSPKPTASPSPTPTKTPKPTPTKSPTPTPTPSPTPTRTPTPVPTEGPPQCSFNDTQTGAGCDTWYAWGNHGIPGDGNYWGSDCVDRFSFHDATAACQSACVEKNGYMTGILTTWWPTERPKGSAGFSWEESDGAGWNLDAGQRYLVKNEEGYSCTIPPHGDCEPGATRSCYTGPDGTKDVGICHGGTQTCGQDHAWGSCQGQQLPEAEHCDEVDHDCNGKPANGPYPGPDAGGQCYRKLGDTCYSGSWVCHAVPDHHLVCQTTDPVSDSSLCD